MTEAYGYYLNNTFDQYDYIGNPQLKNESAIELNAAAQWNNRQLQIGVDANTFLFSNYIIGQFEDRLSAMTVDAEGVKVYGNLPDARIINLSLSARWKALQWLSWSGKVSYARGTDDQGDNLPLISPFAYHTQLDFTYRRFSAQASLQGNAVQQNYGGKYGETSTPAYSIINLNAQYNFSLRKTLLTLRLGVENLLDHAYSTYSDWNKIPQKGRNIYMNLNISL